MKTTSLLRIITLALATASLAGLSHAQTIFEDNFENSPSGNLNGQTTSDGKASYAVTITSSVFQRAITVETNPTLAATLGSYRGQIYDNPSATTYVAISTNLDAVTNYAFTIDYLLFTGSGTFAINARSTSNSTLSSYTFTYSNGNSSIGVSYVDASGVSTSLGTITASISSKSASYYLSDITIQVTGSTQQLYVNGVAYGSLYATQGTAGNGTTDQIRLYTKATSSGAFDVGIDNISASVTAIPEPKTAGLAFGVCSLLAMGCWRLKRR